MALEELRKAQELARQLNALIGELIPKADDLDLQRLLKTIDADLMDLQHKLSLAARIAK